MSRNITLSVSVDREMEEQIMALCKSTKKSVSSVIKEAIAYMFKNKRTEGSAPNEQV